MKNDNWQKQKPTKKTPNDFELRKKGRRKIIGKNVKKQSARHCSADFEINEFEMELVLKLKARYMSVQMCTAYISHSVAMNFLCLLKYRSQIENNDVERIKNQNCNKRWITNTRIGAVERSRTLYSGAPRHKWVIAHTCSMRARCRSVSCTTSSNYTNSQIHVYLLKL